MSAPPLPAPAKTVYTTGSSTPAVEAGSRKEEFWTAEQMRAYGKACAASAKTGSTEAKSILDKMIDRADEVEIKTGKRPGFFVLSGGEYSALTKILWPDLRPADIAVAETGMIRFMSKVVARQDSAAHHWHYGLGERPEVFLADSVPELAKRGG